MAVRFRHMARRQVFLWMSAWQRADAAQPSINQTFIELPCALISEGTWQRMQQVLEFKMIEARPSCTVCPGAMRWVKIDERPELRFLARG